MRVKVTWDGHSGSMARTQQAAQANITLQEQIEAIHKAKGLVQEDETKDKIGPNKPNENTVPPPLPTTMPILTKPSLPINTAPRVPPTAVSTPPLHIHIHLPQFTELRGLVKNRKIIRHKINFFF